jgi:Sensors of blue-light using FAD
VNQTELTHAKGVSAAPSLIFRLIYRSHSKIPPERLDEELGNILRVARANNTAQSITGALLVYDNWFAQTLEGEESAVRKLFAHIAADKRHDSVELREEATVGVRVFSRWAMALVGEHGEPDIPLAATAAGTTPAQARHTTPEQELILAVMRDATRGYGRGS